MCRSGSDFAQGTLQAPVPAQGGSLAYPTCPGGAGVDEMGAGTVDSDREEMHGAWAVEDVEGGKLLADTHLGVASRSHVQHGSGSTRSQHQLPVAVRRQRDLCLCAHQRCWTPLKEVAASSYYSQ